jgi:two-component system, NtrC family, response regulator HydG
VPLLVDHFLGVYCKKNGRQRLVVPPEVMRHLSDYAWPGNVRELENVMERAAVLCRGETLSLEDLPEHVAQSEPSEPNVLTIPLGTPLADVEERLIRETLRHTGGDKSLAAQLLGISTRTIYRKVDGH